MTALVGAVALNEKVSILSRPGVAKRGYFDLVIYNAAFWAVRLASNRCTRNLRRAGVGLAVAVALLLALVLPASAAIEATLSSSEGRRGDFIVLTTDNHGQENLYEGLAAAGPQPIYLASRANFDKEVARGVLLCSAADQRPLGKLTWNSGTGSLPDVLDGDYYFIMKAAESSHSCWRITAPAGPPGPLVFTVKG